VSVSKRPRRRRRDGTRGGKERERGRHTILTASSTNFFPFFTPFGFAMPAGTIPFSAGISNSFSVYTLLFLLPSFPSIDFVFCAPPGLASDMDFCLRLDMPSGALPADLGFEDLALGLLDPDFVLGPDLPLEEGLDGAILACCC
jgi:hypothetical protein